MKQIQAEISRIRNVGEIRKGSSCQGDDVCESRATRKEDSLVEAPRKDELKRLPQKANDFLIQDTWLSKQTNENPKCSATRQKDIAPQTDERCPSYAELLAQVASLRLENSELQKSNQLLRKMVSTE